MKDFLSKFIPIWKPKEIIRENQATIVAEDIGIDPSVLEDVQIAQRLCDHLNLIEDFQERIKALDFLSETAKKSFGNISYQVQDEKLYNAITVFGGQDGVMDFNVLTNVIDTMFEWYNVSAADALTEQRLGKK